MNDTRIEKDSLGEVQVPAAALYGAQTQRAVDNFQLSGMPMPANFIAALGLIKAAAARANAELGLLDPALAASIAYLDTIRARVREGIEMGLSEQEIASVDIEECGLSRVPLSGLVQDLHSANLVHLYRGMIAGTISPTGRRPAHTAESSEAGDDPSD